MFLIKIKKEAFVTMNVKIPIFSLCFLFNVTLFRKKNNNAPCLDYYEKVQI
jgi:hypothetical protein